ncbi:phosphotransferase enzyme family protein [Paracoccus tegillarcae]|uniref:phosphotransferase enzyme family protein n=1 Tax=Paracoccus tegillarcae TaxID=1529068 RepID=UPI0018E687DF|nr:homoserine kinase [Paracoccus tegillarcae]
MNDTAQIVERALALWGLEGSAWSLVAARENRVYRVDHPGGRHALRLHRPGYRSDAELRSELQWVEAVSQGGLSVPLPVPSISGDFLVTVDGCQIDLVHWLDGRQMGATGVPLALDNRTGLFRSIGQEMARLHRASDAWSPAADFTRPAWDRAGLLGAAPLWGRFWENASLSPADRDLLCQFRSRADQALKELQPDLDFGLIHADLVRENLLIDGDRIQLIDFDDGGFGYRLFDLATTLGKTLSEPDFDDLKAALVEGYRAVRPLDTTHLDLFMALRATTYVGWIISRLNEEGAEERSARFIRDATDRVQTWMAQDHAPGSRRTA